MIPAPLEPAEFAELREAHRSGSPDFVVIEPLQLEQQLSWAREFATQTEGPLHILLGFALASERPLRDFSRAVKEDLAVGRRWAIFRMQRVADHIAAWAHANGLKLEIYADADSAPKLVEPADRRQLGPVREDLVRERLHAAIDRMPVSELLRLSLPLEYTIAFDD